MEIKKKILLVEDDQSLAEVYRSRLEMEGFEVIVVHDGEIAIGEIINHRPDLVILDAMLPKISGFDLLDIMRTTPEIMNVRIIMLTALSQSNDRERAESLGVDAYLVKSQITIGDVVNSVRKHLDIPSEAQ